MTHENQFSRFKDTNKQHKHFAHNEQQFFIILTAMTNVVYCIYINISEEERMGEKNKRHLNRRVCKFHCYSFVICEKKKKIANLDFLKKKSWRLSAFALMVHYNENNVERMCVI